MDVHPRTIALAALAAIVNGIIIGVVLVNWGGDDARQSYSTSSADDAGHVVALDDEPQLTTAAEPVATTEPAFATVPPSSPSATAAPVPTATRVPTTTPVPTPTPRPTPAPTPLPNLDKAVPVGRGEVTVPIAGSTRLFLPFAKTMLQRAGHSAVYLTDQDRASEVNIFEPVADANGRNLADLNAVLAHLRSDSAFSFLESLPQTRVDNRLAYQFAGEQSSPPTGALFFTDRKQSAKGWFMPFRLHLWVVDSPRGPVIITAEQLDPNTTDWAAIKEFADQIVRSIEFNG